MVRWIRAGGSCVRVGGDCLKYLKRGWKKKEGRGNKDFKRGDKLGQRVGALKRGGRRRWNPLPNHESTKLVIGVLLYNWTERNANGLDKDYWNFWVIEFNLKSKKKQIETAPPLYCTILWSKHRHYHICWN